MPEITDQDYLLTKQYHDGSNLRARIGLYQFGTNLLGWQQWIFDHYRFPADARILEVGCGPGLLWRENRDRIPRGWAITLTDLSAGMIGEAGAALRDDPRFTFAVCDVQRLPFPDAGFDGVIANHMLYHVPDRARALREVRRVLRAGGRFYATANGRGHLQALRDLLHAFDPALRFAWLGREPFNLDDSREEFTPLFNSVTVDRYSDTLIIPEAGPLVAYGLSSRFAADLPPERRTALHEFIEQWLRTHGPIRIGTDAGLFEAS
jgi:SAM-dependent methyltransferase